eukprot:Awhi_evm1s13775
MMIKVRKIFDTLSTAQKPQTPAPPQLSSSSNFSSALLSPLQVPKISLNSCHWQNLAAQKNVEFLELEKVEKELERLLGLDTSVENPDDDDLTDVSPRSKRLKSNEDESTPNEFDRLYENRVILSPRKRMITPNLKSSKRAHVDDGFPSALSPALKRSMSALISRAKAK